MNKKIILFFIIFFGTHIVYAAQKFKFFSGVCIGTGVGSTATYVLCSKDDSQIFSQEGLRAREKGLRKYVVGELQKKTSFNLSIKAEVTSKGFVCSASGLGIDYKQEKRQDATSIVGFEADLKVSPLAGEFSLIRPGRIRYS